MLGSSISNETHNQPKSLKLLDLGPLIYIYLLFKLLLIFGKNVPNLSEVRTILILLPNLAICLL